MNMVVQNNKIIIIGPLKDIINILAHYPPDTTLREFIKLHLH